MEKIKILMVEDDEDLLTLSTRQIEMRGYEVIPAINGQAALDALSRERVDVILLDVMLPDYDGHQLCKMFRDPEIGYNGPIIFTSCLGDSENVVGAFREGGDDYIVKPIQMDVLEERISENLKKHKKEEKVSEDTGKLWYKYFMIDQKRHEVYRLQEGVVGEKLNLSPKEYKILMLLVNHPGEVLLYRQLYREVWGMDDLDDIRTLMVHVSNLRKKLTAPEIEVITAIRGVGYIFQDIQ